MSIIIAYLKHHLEEIPALAKIWHSVLGSIWAPDIPIDRMEQRFREQLNDELLPITFVDYFF